MLKRLTNSSLLKLSAFLFVCFLVLATFNLFSDYLIPANRTSHECKKVPNITFPSKTGQSADAGKYEQKFCEQGYYPEFKSSWSNAIGFLAVILMFISTPLLIATAALQLIRRLKFSR